MATFHTSTAPIDEIEAQLLLLLVPENPGPLIGGAGLADWRMEGKLARILLERRCLGAQGERLLVLNVPKLASHSAALAGLGKLQGAEPGEIAGRVIAALVDAKKAGAGKIVVAADYLVGEGRPFGGMGALVSALNEHAQGQSKMLPADVTLATLDLNLF